MLPRRRRLYTGLLLLGLFLVALIPRALYPVSRPLQWYERSYRFVEAVADARWADTVVSEHPGVTPMWLIGLAQHGYYALLRARGIAPADPLHIEGRAFYDEIAVSVLPLALVIALGVLAVWWFLKQLLGEGAAWAGAGFLALDPFHVAISKVVHVDALLSVLMILSALSLLLHLRRDRRGERRGFWLRYRWLMASGGLAGLAFLTKSPAYFLVPFLGLSLLVSYGRRRPLRNYLLPAVLWGAAAALTYGALWPAMWVAPLRTLGTVFGGVLKHTGRVHPQPIYYLGELITHDPGVSFYVLSLLVKTTVVSLPFFLIGLLGPLVPMWRGRRRELWLIVAYFAFFVVQMSLGAKKAPRYLLPAFCALDVIAGVGLVSVARRVVSWRARFPLPFYLAAVLALQALLVLPYHPYYIAHANVLVGGPAGGQRILLATPEGEGLDRVARHLNEMSGAEALRVGAQLPAQEALRQHFVGEITDTRAPDLDYLIFADVYVQRRMAEDQWGAQWERYKYHPPAYTADVRGLPHAWLYRVDEGAQEPATPQEVCLGENIRLRGYTLLDPTAASAGPPYRPGQTLYLTLHWEATGVPAQDYSVFVHLIGPDGALVAQWDNWPLQGTYPTPLWEPGERVDDPYPVALPADAPPGTYTLLAGMYDWRTGERLEARADCRTPLPDDAATLAQFRVHPAGAPWWQGPAILAALGTVVGGAVAVGPDLTPLRRGLRRWWMPLLYVGLTLVMTYPLALRLRSHYVGTGGDLLIFQWNDWWCRKCLVEGRNPLFTRWLFHPQGVSLVYHNFAWVNTAMWLPLSPILGATVTYNLIFLFNIALGGVGMHLLARELTRDEGAATLAGLIFAFWPCRMSHYNHPNMVAVGWIPLFFLFLIRTVRGERKGRWALLTGLTLALVGLSRWLHLLFTGGMLALYLTYSLLVERRRWTRRTVVALALAFGVALVLMAPLLSPLVVAQLRGGEQGETIYSTDPDLYSVDLAGYFVPDRAHPVFKPWLSGLWARMRRGSYVGYTVLALVALGAWRGRRDRWVWLALGGGLFVLSLGPSLLVAGRDLGLTLPYAWVQELSVVEIIRHPNRFCVPLSLPVALLAGYGAAWLLGRVRRPRVWLLAGMLLVLFEYWPLPYPTAQVEVSPFYHQLAEEPGAFGVLDVPMGDRTVAKTYMYFATVHGKPLVEGHVSRLPPSAYDFVDSVPLLRGLHARNEMDPTLGDVSRQLDMLAQAGVRYVILHPPLAPAEQVARWRAWMAFRPAYEDPELVVYRTAPAYGRDFAFAAPLTDGIGLITATVSHTDTVTVEALWGTERAPRRDWAARVTLVSQDGAVAQAVDFLPCAGWPTAAWGADAVARGRVTLPVDADVPAGRYTVRLSLVDPATGERASPAVPVGQVEVGS